jgi:superoxide dismutase, Fe-Mn family
VSAAGVKLAQLSCFEQNASPISFSILCCGFDRHIGLPPPSPLAGQTQPCPAAKEEEMKAIKTIASEFASALDLPPLPWPEDALEPAISARTVKLHHGKHHRAYLEKTAGLIAGTPLEGRPLAEIVVAAASKGSATDGEPTPLFNSAAQAWNHQFYWQSLSPDATKPSGRLADLLQENFGGIANFEQSFVKAASEQFGSGWAWLIADDNQLRIETTSNAGTPMANGRRCLLCVDVWEHAYYLDHQNDRAKHLKALMPHLNWRFATTQLAQVL